MFGTISFSPLMSRINSNLLMKRAAQCLAVAFLASACKNRVDVMEGNTAGEGRILNIAQGTDLEFRWIPAGTFNMGSPDQEEGRNPDEALQTVKISKGYWMATHETTMAIWQKVMGEPEKLKATSRQLPAARISWHDCRKFLSRLQSPAPGWKYELPSEAEWEYACRAGNPNPYHDVPDAVAWLSSNSGGRRHPVGGKAPNAWQLQDMHGNVAEWCRNAVDGRGNEMAIRGGSWDSDLSARAAARNSDTPFLRINRVGFRLVLVRDDATPAANHSVSPPTHTRLP